MKRIVSSVLCGIVGINTMLYAEAKIPRLVVGITVDNLSTDRIEDLQSLFSDGGFRRFMRDGVFLHNINFGIPDVDKVSGTAMLQTGSYPRHNGISTSRTFKVGDNSVRDVLHDATAIGNFTDRTYSPSAIRVSTLADELKAATNGSADIYSLSADPQQAIIMTGHAGNSAVWFNDNTGRWSSTTYYKDLPSEITRRNYNSPVSERIDTMQWMPLLEAEKYPSSRLIGKSNFKYSFPRSDRDVYTMFASSPMMNREITDVAISYLKELSLGNRHDAPDMLNLGYSVSSFSRGVPATSSLETEDSYLRLDLELQRLLKALDSYVGIDNVLVYVMPTGSFDPNRNYDPKYNIPGGVFSAKRALSLLNSYLAAEYGNGSYVAGFHGRNIYLDHKTLEQKNLKHEEVAAKARDFTAKMSGVNDSFILSDLKNSQIPAVRDLYYTIDPKNSGDIILTFNEGWSVADDTVYPEVVQNVNSALTLSPGFLLGAGLAPAEITEEVDVTAIAPTVARVLRIRSPNGAVSKPVDLKWDNKK